MDLTGPHLHLLLAMATHLHLHPLNVVLRLLPRQLEQHQLINQEALLDGQDPHPPGPLLLLGIVEEH